MGKKGKQNQVGRGSASARQRRTKNRSKEKSLSAAKSSVSQKGAVVTQSLPEKRVIKPVDRAFMVNDTGSQSNSFFGDVTPSDVTPSAKPEGVVKSALEDIDNLVGDVDTPGDGYPDEDLLTLIKCHLPPFLAVVPTLTVVTILTVLVVVLVVPVVLAVGNLRLDFRGVFTLSRMIGVFTMKNRVGLSYVCATPTPDRVMEDTRVRTMKDTRSVVSTPSLFVVEATHVLRNVLGATPIPFLMVVKAILLMKWWIFSRSFCVLILIGIRNILTESLVTQAALILTMLTTMTVILRSVRHLRTTLIVVGVMMMAAFVVIVTRALFLMVVLPSAFTRVFGESVSLVLTG